MYITKIFIFRSNLSCQDLNCRFSSLQNMLKSLQRILKINDDHHQLLMEIIAKYIKTNSDQDLVKIDITLQTVRF